MTALKEWLRDYWYVPVAVVIAAGFAWWQLQPTATPLEIAPVSSSLSSSASASSGTSATAAGSSTASQAQAGYVHVKGAVKNPGLYPVTGSTRWAAVVQAAGGLTAEADVTTINLAKLASDQESLYIPTQGEASPAGTDQATAPAVAGEPSGGGLVDLNQADLTQLQTLSGIGPKKAADIIAYRDSSGGFKAIEELKNVPGIGDKTYEKLAPLITVGP